MNYGQISTSDLFDYKSSSLSFKAAPKLFIEEDKVTLSPLQLGDGDAYRPSIWRRREVALRKSFFQLQRCEERLIAQ
jgi:hypothetical protein